MNNYQLEFELQWSYFLKDCLHEEISFELEERPVKSLDSQGFKEEKVIIYKKQGKDGWYEEITLDEFMFGLDRMPINMQPSDVNLFFMRYDSD